MLTFLRVKNLALISDIELELSEGLTVLTGETGAGKSLLIQAISLLTGKRPSEALLRRGENRAVVEGILTLDPTLKARLAETGFAADDTILQVKRIIQKNGPNRAQINDETATLTVLRSFLEDRIQISGQHDHTTLKDPEVQLWMLDAFGGLLSNRGQFSDSYWHYRDISKKLLELENWKEREKQERELYTFQLREIEAAGLSEEEYRQLKEEKTILNHAGALLKNSQRALDLLCEMEAAAIPQVQEALQHVEEMAGVDTRVKETLKNLKEADILLDEAAGDLQRYGSKIEFEPRRLEEIEERLTTYATLIRKYGGTLAAVQETQMALKHRLLKSEDLDGTITALSGARAEAWATLITAGRDLSKKRKKEARTFSRQIAASLRELGMATAVFQVAFTPETLPNPLKEADVTDTGFDAISFLFSANRGEPPLPIKEVASGGELSRIFLAVKALITGSAGTQTIVFDEVDAGIGGRVADIVGRRIAEISKQAQVLCITHLPQIAAYGDHHLLITKNEIGHRTQIGVKRLTEKARIAELARMLGGEITTQTTLQHAEELFAAAQSQKGNKT